jgi:hypothetical protein
MNGKKEAKKSLSYARSARVHIGILNARMNRKAIKEKK